MNRGRVKSIILLLLLVNSLFLSSYIWFSGELWPSGYNSFVLFGQNGIISELFKKRDKTNSIPIENLSKPDKIIITNGDNRSVFYNTDQNFDPVFNASRKMLRDVFSDKSITSRRAEVTSEEWYSVLRNDEILDTKSVYMSYGIAFSSDLFSSVIGVFDTWVDGITAVKDFIIAPVGSEGNETLLYIKEYNSEVVHKFYVNYPEKENIIALFNDLGGEENYSYSFELNLDGSAAGLGTGIEQKVFLSSDVLISPNATESRIIKSSNPMERSSEKLMGVFGYSAGSPRRYTDENETVHYVENYSSLSISKAGMIEYSAVGAGNGIELFEDSGRKPSFYECLNGAIEFSDRVWKTVVPGQDYNVLVTSNLLEDETNPDEYTITLDYYFEGTRITTDKSDTKNAVEIKIKNGRITKYRHLIRNFETNGETVTNKAMIMALDGIYNMFSDTTDKIVINDIFLSYVEDGKSDEKAPKWCIKVSGENSLFFYGGD